MASRLARAVKPFRDAQGLSKWLLWLGIGGTLLVFLVAIFAPWLAPYDFNQVSSGGERFPKQAPPSSEHWFGTSVRSEDVFSRVIFGARIAVQVVVLAVAASLLVGVPLGLISGYVGGWVDRVLVLISDALFAFPYLILAIVIAFLLADAIGGGGVVTAALAITVVYVPQYFRVVRNNTLSAREATYVEAAKALGARPRTVIGRYLFGNVIQSVPVIGTLNAADAMLTLAGLGFLGYGIQPTEGAEWGYDLQRAIVDVQADIWWTSVFPGLAIVFFVVALTLVGEGLNDTLNPTLRKRRIEPVHIPPRDRRDKEAAAR